MNKMEIIFDSKLENIKFARSCAVMFLHDLNLTLGFANEVKTIVSEAVTNSIIHGYNYKEDQKVYLKMEYDNELIKIYIIDHGIGIKDIKLAMMPTYSTLSSEERSGLGFTIIDIFSDKLNISSEYGKTVVEVSKKIKRDEECD